MTATSVVCLPLSPLPPLPPPQQSLFLVPAPQARLFPLSFLSRSVGECSPPSLFVLLSPLGSDCTVPRGIESGVARDLRKVTAHRGGEAGRLVRRACGSDEGGTLFRTAARLCHSPKHSLRWRHSPPLLAAFCAYTHPCAAHTDCQRIHRRILNPVIYNGRPVLSQA